MKISVDNEFFNSSKFRRLPFTARMLYIYCTFNRDYCGAISEATLEDLVLLAGASDDDVIKLLNNGYLLFVDAEAKFYVDAYFNLHNSNLPHFLRKSNFQPLIEKYLYIDKYSHEFKFKNHDLDSRGANLIAPLQTKLIEINLSQSQNLNIITNYNKTDTESGENEPNDHSQNLNIDTRLNMDSVFKIFGKDYSKDEIMTGLNILESQNQTKIRNKIKYLGTILRNNAKKEPQSEKKKKDFPDSQLKVDIQGTDPMEQIISDYKSHAVQVFNNLEEKHKEAIVQEIFNSNSMIKEFHHNNTQNFLESWEKMHKHQVIQSLINCGILKPIGELKK